MRNQHGSRLQIRKAASGILTIFLLLLCVHGRIAAQAKIINASIPDQARLAETFKGKFLIGAALNEAQFSGKDERGAALARTHFNSITPENVLKWESAHPEPGKYSFGAPDQFVAFGEMNSMVVIGHTLVWHNQTPKWVFKNNLPSDSSKLSDSFSKSNTSSSASWHLGGSSSFFSVYQPSSFRSENSISGVAQARKDVSFVVKFAIEASAKNLNVRMMLSDHFHPCGRRDKTNDTDILRPLLFQKRDCRSRTPSRREHWINKNHQCLRELTRKFRIVVDRLQCFFVPI